MEKDKALREAQLMVKKRYPHPYYRAAFQLTGLPK
jgi:CHAT domain-containing protein